MFEKVVLELGGNPKGRLSKAIELATQMPDSFLLLSSESSPAYCLNTIKSAGISPDRFYLDYTAWDTVTNFVCTYPKIMGMGCKELYIVTDGFHMKRSMLIANATYFKRGVKLIPSPSSPVDRKEDKKLVMGDTARAWLDRLTGSLLSDQQVYNNRIPAIQDDYYVARQRQVNTKHDV